MGVIIYRYIYKATGWTCPVGRENFAGGACVGLSGWGRLFQAG
jgi:hypothetical protein